MKVFVLLLALIGCTIAAAAGQDVIRPKISFREAETLLQKHQAEPTTIQIAYPSPTTNRRIEHFILADGRTIELSLTRKKEGAEWTIKAIFEIVWPRYEQSREKEWRPITELILKEPIQPPQTTTGSSAPDRV